MFVFMSALSSLEIFIHAHIQTNYIYFVAKPDFNGYSNFATTYAEHLVFAKAYQDALDDLMKAKAAK